MKKVVTTIILSITLLSCSHEKVNVYVGNASFNEPNIDIKIMFNDKVVINKSFKSDSITPNLEKFKIEKPSSSDLISLTVFSEKAGIKYEKKIDINKINYIYIEYKYKVINDSLNLLENQGYERIQQTSDYIITPREFVVGFSKDEKLLE